MIFKGLSVAKNCLRPESAPLKFLQWKENFVQSFFFAMKLTWSYVKIILFVSSVFRVFQVNLIMNKCLKRLHFQRCFSQCWVYNGRNISRNIASLYTFSKCDSLFISNWTQFLSPPKFLSPPQFYARFRFSQNILVGFKVWR